MPEGDTLFRTAAGLRPHLVGRRLLRARVRPPGPRVERLVGATIMAVDSVGKNLLIRFEGGWELRSHLGMHGTWHRYRPGEAWRRAPARARLVLEVDDAVAVCFDAPTLELLETRAEAVHAPLARLGPDLLGAWTPDDEAEAVRRLRDPSRATLTVAEGLLDQTAVAGIGNIWKNETLWAERVFPFAPLAALDEPTLRQLLATARSKLRASAEPGGRRPTMAAYGRAGRPCRRCGTVLRSRTHGALARRTTWCPRCQAAPAPSARSTREAAG
ncbi:MAG TPA: DNA-formamidopyrimidine glycosylase family protein [Candidatus Limnocylindrales bacterium]